MRPPNLEVDVFKSIPTSISFSGKTYTIVTDYAHLSSVRDMLSSADVAITISYFGDQNAGGHHSPVNMMLRSDAGTDERYVENLVGQRYTCQMSINVHVAQSDMYNAVGLLESVMRKMSLWSHHTLRDITEVMQLSPITDLTHLEDGLLRKQFDITIRYPFAIWQVLPTIAEVVGDVEFVEGDWKSDPKTFYVDLRNTPQY